MKRLFLFCLTFLILISNIGYAGQEKIVTSETLTISDIESSIFVAPLKKSGVPLTIAKSWGLVPCNFKTRLIKSQHGKTVKNRI